MRLRRTQTLRFMTAAFVVALAAGCSSSSAGTGSPGGGQSATPGKLITVRLGAEE